MINRPKPLLCVEHIEKYYGNQGSVTKALNQVSFYVQHGEFVSIMGASGSGKTTLLNCISTIDTVSAGHILLDGKDITTISEDDISAFRRDNLGFVCILQQLGMNRRDIEKLNNRQLSMMFLLPLLPALIISSCFVYVSAGKMQLSAFHLPVFSNNLWIIGSLSIAFVFFILLYGVYYIAARISYRRQ